MKTVNYFVTGKSERAGADTDVSAYKKRASATPPEFHSSTIQNNTDAQWFFYAGSATITTFPIVSTKTGTVAAMTSSVRNQDLIDPENFIIADMSDDDVLKTVLAMQGSWADRDDLDEILDRSSDRIDELYGFANDPHTLT